MLYFYYFKTIQFVGLIIMANNDDDLEALVKRLQITTHEGSSTSSLEVSSNSWRYSLDGKVLVIDHSVRFKTLQNTLLSMWAQFGIQTISPLQSNLFLLELESVQGANKVFDDGPWAFQQDFIVLQKASRNKHLHEYLFDKISIRIQLHNLPLNFLSPRQCSSNSSTCCC